MTEELHVTTDSSADMPRVKVTYTVNVPMLLTAAGFIVVAAFWVRGVESDIANIKNAAVVRNAAVDQNLANVNMILRDMPNVLYRLGVSEQQLERLSTNVVTSVEGMRKELSTLSTKVEVLSQKIDATPRRTASPVL